MERGIIMIGHSLVIGLLLYVFMLYVLKQRAGMAEDRSVLVAAAVLMYMVLFGHGLPGKINRNIL
jgi:hypothetical protein